MPQIKNKIKRVKTAKGGSVPKLQPQPMQKPLSDITNVPKKKNAPQPGTSRKVDVCPSEDCAPTESKGSTGNRHREEEEDIDLNGDRLLVEYCCSPDSELGKPTRASRGCSVLRLTEKEDMTKEDSVTRAIEQIMKFKNKPNITHVKPIGRPVS